MNGARTQKKIKAEARRNRRAVYVGVFLCACLVGLMFRIYYFQTVWGDEYTRFSVMQEARRYITRATNEIAPLRGTITDRNMNPIVGSQPMFEIFLDVIELQRRHERNRDINVNVLEYTFEIIGETFNIPRSQLAERFATNPDGTLVRPTHHFIIARNVLPETAFMITERIPEIHATQESVRFFYAPYFAPPIIGFQRGDALWGLESLFDWELSGDPGRTVWVQGEVEEIPVRDGYTIVTTLCPDIQGLAQRYVNNTFIQHPSRFVGIIVMCPFTSEIFAMAQAPTFSLAEPMNPDFITNTRLVERWDRISNEELIDEMMYLWRNYHITMSGEPGSIFKPIVMAAAIEEGLIDANSHFYCEGVREVADQHIWCWNTWGHGAMCLREALAISCNLAFVDINNRLGANLFYRYRGYFGFGELTGIDLPGEWAVSEAVVMYQLYRLGAVEMGTSGMGQGFNSTTLQSINGMAAVINGGVLMRPFIVSRIIDANGNIVFENAPQMERRVISQQTSDFMRREMEYVMTFERIIDGWPRRGTGRPARVAGHAIAGKTGTAQQGERIDGRNSLSMILYTPIENPEFIVLMIIDSIDDYRAMAGSTLAPIMGNFMRDLIQLRNIQPTDDPIHLWQAAQVQEDVMPDFSGQRLADVVRNLNIANQAGYHVVGRGTVILRTIPAAGQPMPLSIPIFFYMDPNSVIEDAMVSVPDVNGLPLDVATQFLIDAGLPVATVRTERALLHEDELFAHTRGAEPIEDDDTPVVERTYYVYRQFPLPGTEIEMGTEVLLRIRPEDD